MRTKDRGEGKMMLERVRKKYKGGNNKNLNHTGMRDKQQRKDKGEGLRTQVREKGYRRINKETETGKRKQTPKIGNEDTNEGTRTQQRDLNSADLG